MIKLPCNIEFQDAPPSSIGAYKRTFSVEMEKKLVAYLKELDELFHGLPQKKLQSLAYEFAEKNNIPHRFNHSVKLAGEKWVRSFRNRHGLALRTPERVSQARAMGFNKIQLKRYFDNLERVYQKKKFEPSRIYNMDETGLSTVPNKTPKVVTTKGKRDVSKICSAERGQTITAVCCVSASGHYVPPAMIFPRKRIKPELTAKAPAGTLQLCSDSGYMNTELFYEWLKHFKKHVKPSADDPVLLVLDNHSSHCSIEAIDYCRENHIILLSIPPHSSHRTQPLDVVYYGPLKTVYATEVDRWLSKHPGRVVTQADVGKIFSRAYNEVSTLGKAVQGFRCTGIYPFDKDIFRDEMFRAAEVTHSKW